MSDRTELEELRRLDELERKAAGAAPPQQPAPAAPETRWYDDLNAGIAHGASKVVRGVGTLLPNAIAGPLEKRGIIPSEQDVATLSKMSDTPLGTVGSIGMDMTAVGALPLGAVAKGAEYVPALGKALQARGLLPAVARTADVAATQAATSAAISPDDRADAAKWGAVGGAGGQVLGRVASGLVRPTDEARVLMERGVALTPGQAAGAGSMWARAEQNLSSNPISAMPIRNAQRRAVEEANKAAAESVASIVQQNVKLGLPPREAIEQTRDLISNAYHQSLEGMNWPAQGLATDLKAAMTHLPNDLPLVPAKTVREIETYLNNRLGPWVKQGGDMTGEQLKQVDAELGQMARNLANSQNTTERVQAPAWREVQSYVRSAMEEAAATPEQHALLSKANTAYRQLLALEKAMLPGNNTFTPRRLKATLERMGIKDTDLNRVAGAMEKTLPNTVNDSGTAERLLTNALPALLMGGGGVAQGFGFDTLGVGMMAAGALGSRPGSRLMTGGYAPQQMVADALRRTVPAATRAVSAPSGGQESNER